MEYKVSSKYIRTSTRKLRLIADGIRGRTVTSALRTLLFIPKAGKTVFIKLIKSALANAKKTENDGDTFVISNIDVSGGPAMKRFMAVSRCMAHKYKKRMTHVTLTMTERGEK